ncbi:MAG: OmpA family protein [Lewinellaceae bacterium]|nr:OmpA family protein [Lewinellaceae bacterium]
MGHHFRLSPKTGNYSFIFIEAYYKTPVLFPYNGNILIDNASPIKQIVCGPEKMPETKPSPPIAVPTKDRRPKTNHAPKGTDQTRHAVKEKPEPVKPSAAVELSAKRCEKASTYRLEKVYFDANKYELKDGSEQELRKLYNFLNANTDVVVEVGGHTNNAMWPDSSFAYNLSTNRAKSVAKWLIAKGISSNRMLYKGYGWKMPIEPNTTPKAGAKTSA